MNANEIAALSGVSVRTLHHYDAIGLLRPARNPENGYREYGEKELALLQQILFFKACGFELERIRELLASPSFDRARAYALQEKYLQHERTRIDAMLDTLRKSQKELKGEISMTQKEKFAGFDFNNDPYEEEARRLYGDETIDQSKAHFAAMSKSEQNAVAQGMDDLFKSLASLRLEQPGSPAAQEAMAGMYAHFNKNFGYHYTPEAFAGVGQLYVTDERFTKNIDKYGEGLSAFLAEAMRIWAENAKTNS